MKKITILLTALTLALTTGCTINKSISVNTVDLKQTNMKTLGKKGESCVTYVFNLFPIGNASIVDAAKSQNIETITLVDEKSGFYLLWSKRCKVVYGL